MSETTVYLIRHSEQLREKGINNNNQSEQDINEKIVLSVDGEKKAKELSQMEELKNIDEIWSSNYVRAKQTAKYIATENNLEINIDARLGERKLGDLEALKELGKDKKNSFTEEQLLDENFKNIDGENRKEVNERMSEIITEVINKNVGKRIAIISHGAAIKFYLMNWCELNNDCQLIYDSKIIEVNSPRNN